MPLERNPVGDVIRIFSTDISGPRICSMSLVFCFVYCRILRICSVQRQWSRCSTCTGSPRTSATGSGGGRYSKPLRSIPRWRVVGMPASRASTHQTTSATGWRASSCLRHSSTCICCLEMMTMYCRSRNGCSIQRHTPFQYGGCKSLIQ